MMNKKTISADLNKVDEKVIGLLKELQERGFVTNDGFLFYDDSDKESIAGIFSKYGKSFLE